MKFPRAPNSGVYPSVRGCSIDCEEEERNEEYDGQIGGILRGKKIRIKGGKVENHEI